MVRVRLVKPENPSQRTLRLPSSNIASLETGTNLTPAVSYLSLNVWILFLVSYLKEMSSDLTLLEACDTM